MTPSDPVDSSGGGREWTDKGMEKARVQFPLQDARFSGLSFFWLVMLQYGCWISPSKRPPELSP